MTKVILVDDEPWSRELVKSLAEWGPLGLELAGEADDGQSGLELVRRSAADIVVTDMRMPGLDGVAFLQRLEEEFPRLKIVVMSGYEDVAYLKQAIHSRAVEYLMKPLDATELNRALVRCLDDLAASPTGSVPRPLLDPVQLERYNAFRTEARVVLLAAKEPALAPFFQRLGEFLDGLWRGEPPAGGGDRVLRDFGGLLEEFLVENGSPVPPQGPLPSSSFGPVLSHLETRYRSAIQALVEGRQHRGRLDLTAVEAYIDDHCLEVLSLESLSAVFFINKEHLSRTFKAHFGQNVSDRIVQRKMEKAGEFLRSNQLTVKHVALVTGYEDLGYFYRVFRRFYGCTPVEYRSRYPAPPQ